MTRLPANRSDLTHSYSNIKRTPHLETESVAHLQLALISSMLHRKLRLTLSCRTCRCKLFEHRCRNPTVQHHNGHQHFAPYFASLLQTSSNIPETNAHQLIVAVECCPRWPGMGLMALQKIAPGNKMATLAAAPKTPETSGDSTVPTAEPA